MAVSYLRVPEWEDGEAKITVNPLVMTSEPTGWICPVCHIGVRPGLDVCPGCTERANQFWRKSINVTWPKDETPSA